MFFSLAVGLVAGLLPVAFSGVSDNKFLMQVDFDDPVKQVVRYGADTRYIPRSLLPLQQDDREVLENDFIGWSYFGAFAIGKNGGYGYAVGVNSAQAAREIALSECRSSNDRCVIYAEIWPEGYQTIEPGEVVLAPDVAEYYFSANTRPDFKSMAFSHDGAYALVWGHASQAAADAAALADCDSYRMSGDDDFPVMPCLLLPIR